jgi:hypothetical protein
MEFPDVEVQVKKAMAAEPPATPPVLSLPQAKGRKFRE